MDRKKGLDLTGRLSRKVGPAGGKGKNASSYGTDRLGITRADEPPETEPFSAPQPQPPIPPAQPEEAPPAPGTAHYDLSATEPTDGAQTADAMRQAIDDLGRMEIAARAVAVGSDEGEGFLARWMAACRVRPVLWALPVAGLAAIVGLTVLLNSGEEPLPSAGPRSARGAHLPSAAAPRRPNPPRTSRIVPVPKDPARRVNRDDPYATEPRRTDTDDAEPLPSILAAGQMPRRSRRSPVVRPPERYPWVNRARELRRHRPGRGTPPEEHFKATSRPAEPAPANPAASPSPQPRPAQVPPPPPRREPASQPTAGPATRPAPIRYVPRPPGFWFTGVIDQPTGTYANVNDRFVKVGQTVNGAKVIRISRTSVEMQRGRERFFVTFGSRPAPSRPEEGEQPDASEDEADEPGGAAGHRPAG